LKIGNQLRIDCASTGLHLLDDYAAIARRFKATAQRSCIDCAVIAQQLLGDRKASARRLRTDSSAIAWRFGTNVQRFYVIAQHRHQLRGDRKAIAR
jgi:hypothetical protein